MTERADFLISYAREHGPVTVRQLYYQAEVAGLPGIGKDENSYAKIQRQVLSLRRSGDLAYGDIADATRWMRKLKSYDDRLHDALGEFVQLRWRDTGVVLDISLDVLGCCGRAQILVTLRQVHLGITGADR
jgi:hypothetical protein